MEEHIKKLLPKRNIGFNIWDLEQFQKETPRKMTLHLLSKYKIDCISFVEYLTQEKVFDSKNELLEEQITKKINLYSFINYKIYTKVSELMKSIKQKAENDKENLNLKDKSVISIYSEVIIIFDNVDIKEQIREINHIINNENYKFMKETYYFPFFILITCKDLDLKYFIESKTFQYKIEFDNINIFLNKKENLGEFFEIIKKINSLFIYYNELGDEFSFINSEGKEVLMKSVDDTNIPIFINILLLGRSGAGKSTLVNLMLDEKKSLEGGTGFSTTSKKIIIYKKENIPIRFFDVKGAEDGKSIEDNLKLLTIFNGKISNFDINLNAIFYCIKFDPTTVILNFEKKIFEKLSLL